MSTMSHYQHVAPHEVLVIPVPRRITWSRVGLVLLISGAMMFLAAVTWNADVFSRESISLYNIVGWFASVWIAASMIGGTTAMLVDINVKAKG